MCWYYWIVSLYFKLNYIMTSLCLFSVSLLCCLLIIVVWHWPSDIIGLHLPVNSIAVVSEHTVLTVTDAVMSEWWDYKECNCFMTRKELSMFLFLQMFFFSFQNYFVTDSSDITHANRILSPKYRIIYNTRIKYCLKEKSMLKHTGYVYIEIFMMCLVMHVLIWWFGLCFCLFPENLGIGSCSDITGSHC